jgi:hypothetical protein
VSGRRGGLTTWVEAVRTAWAFRSRRWWLARPRVSLPDRAYSQWRSYTAYGDPDASISASDLVSFLVWRTGVRKYVRQMR